MSTKQSQLPPRKIQVIYITGPFTSPDPCANTRRAMDYWEALRQDGYIPICPHWSLIQQLHFPLSHRQWLDYDKQLIYRCADALFRIPGESPGADEEVQLAHEIGIPVFHSYGALQAYVTESQRHHRTN